MAATLTDVAKRAGVSAMTVSRVVNGRTRVSHQTRARVLKAVEELNYIPNRLARSLVQRRSRMLGLIVPDVTNPFFTTIARGVEDAARSKGYQLILCNSDESPEKEAEYLAALAAARVDGAIVAPAGDRSAGNLALLHKHSIPFVLVDREVPGVEADVILGDSHDGSYRLVRHLIEEGHKRIALINGPLAVSTARDRLSGYRSALKEARLPVDETLIKESSFLGTGVGELVDQILALEGPPTAIFAANNFVGLSVLARLRERRLRIPRDVAVVCFDDIPWVSRLDPFLTVATQPAYEFGTLSTHLLLDRIDHPARSDTRKIVLQPDLVIRRSSRRVAERNLSRREEGRVRISAEP